jgi:hypothetical protein
MARILLIGDSHIKEMQPLFKTLAPKNTEITLFSIQIGRGITEITNKYRDNLLQAYYFDPNISILHAGHNNIAAHHWYNPIPDHPRIVANDTLLLATEIKTNFPSANVHISTVFPRTFTANSLLTAPEISSFNQKIKRHAQHLCSITQGTTINCLMNMPMWTQVSKAIENPSHFDTDGLHLTKEGKSAVIKEWFSEIL